MREPSAEYVCVCVCVCVCVSVYVCVCAGKSKNLGSGKPVQLLAGQAHVDCTVKDSYSGRHGAVLAHYGLDPGCSL
jgi:hypothetical protein